MKKHKKRICRFCKLDRGKEAEMTMHPLEGGGWIHRSPCFEEVQKRQREQNKAIRPKKSIGYPFDPTEGL